MASELIAEAITDYFGERFPAKSREHEPVNSTCQIRELAA